MAGLGIARSQDSTSPIAADKIQSNQSDPATELSGAAASADFDSLIDLIQSTVAYDTWSENGTGDGEITPFAINGIYADPQGTLRFARNLDIAEFPSSEYPADTKAAVSNARQASPLRFVSLPRLEKAIRNRQQNHAPLLPEMLTLAGLERIEYVIVSPKTSEILLAGPAGDWRLDEARRLVSVATGRPVVRLDDLLTLWRREDFGLKPFGCSIVPRQQSLARTQEFLAASASHELEPSQRRTWLADLRKSLGKQDVKYFGLPPDSHVAAVLLLADYHMKLIGMGLAEGTPGVESYLETVTPMPDGSAPPMSVLRWWFAMNYPSVESDAERELYRIPHTGVQVLSENEFLATRGERIHTNQSDELNSRFAASFTTEFAAISGKFPLYTELQNVFDIALVLAVLQKENLLQRTGWSPTLFTQSAELQLPKMRVPQEVESVINHRILNRRHLIVGVSGGVWVDPSKSLRVETTSKNQVRLKANARGSTPDQQRWWWDEADSADSQVE